MSRRESKRLLQEATRRAGLKDPAELFPFLRALPAERVEVVDGKRKYSTAQILEAIEAWARQRKT